MASPQLRRIITLVALAAGVGGLSVFSFSARAQSAALCRIRPDLCKKKLPDSTSDTTAPKCRVANKAYNLEQSDLPVCKTKTNPKAKRKQNKVEDDSLLAEFENSAAETNGPSGTKRQPASLNSNFSFDAYMTANASHPALNNRVRDHQNAFVDTARPATITFPGEGNSIKESDPIPAAAPPPASAPSATASAPAAAPFR